MDGIVIVDKPKGPTSHDVVQFIKKIYGADKAGHTGTLDPMATGVLPVCLNGATKKAGEFASGDKEYEVTVLFGVTTDTFDLEGSVLRNVPVPADIVEKARMILPEFTGVIEQKPPYYSAVKHQGLPLYKWARKGRFIDLPPRKVEIKAFEIKDSNENSMVARIVCSKGTYIRSLCSDLGEKLGVGACVGELRRLKAGPFGIDMSVTLDVLRRGGEDILKYVFSEVL